MKIAHCRKCNLCKSRLHVSFGKGASDANVLVIFGKEPIGDKTKIHMSSFLEALDEYLEGDIKYTYAIRCSTKKAVNIDHIKACRVWLEKIIKKTDPFLIILMGSISVRAVFGDKYRNLPKNTYFNRILKSGTKRKYFIGSKISSNYSILEDNIKKLVHYIKESYG